MKNPVSVGVVGCGYWGPNHIRNFRTLPTCALKAMCDVNEGRLKHLKALYPEVEGLTDYNHMLNGIGLDAVVIATSVKHHYPLAKASLLAGKHSLIEKPMASSSEDRKAAFHLSNRPLIPPCPLRPICGEGISPKKGPRQGKSILT